jgi:hypothetical protein
MIRHVSTVLIVSSMSLEMTERRMMEESGG